MGSLNCCRLSLTRLRSNARFKCKGSHIDGKADFQNTVAKPSADEWDCPQIQQASTTCDQRGNVRAIAFSSFETIFRALDLLGHFCFRHVVVNSATSHSPSKK